jgi:hypothetical protein
MKKIIAIVLALGIVSGPGYCDMPPVQLQLTVDKTEIFTTEFPTYTVNITNTDTGNMQVIDTDHDGSEQQWVVDNPKIAVVKPKYGADGSLHGVVIHGGIPVNIDTGRHNLKPGESYQDQLGVYFPERISNYASWNSSTPEPITLRVGFKVTPDSEPVWSNPVTISFKRYEDLSAANKLESEDINIDTRCFPYGEHIKGATAAPTPPIIEDKLIINDEQTYEQTFKRRSRDPNHVSGCTEENEYKECMKFACRAVPSVANDPQKLFECADNPCRTAAPNYAKGCQELQKIDQACLTINLPPIDFSQKTILGQFTSGTCGTTGFKKEVFRDDKTKTITYFVTAINTIADCMGPGGQSMNLIAVPKVPTDYKVNFSYKFQ